MIPFFQKALAPHAYAHPAHLGEPVTTGYGAGMRVGALHLVRFSGAGVGLGFAGLYFGALFLSAFGSSPALGAEVAPRTLSDYRAAAEERTRNPSHKTSPDGIGPDYKKVGNKPRQFDIGVALYDANDFAGAYAIWLPLAQRDDIAAQRNVAHLLRHGKGTPQDLPRALYFYERASEGGLVPAAVNAGMMHLKGEGTPVAPETALRYLAVGVQSKHPVALYEVSLMLANGMGVEKNPAKARAYLELSAGTGYAPAVQKLNEVKAADLISTQKKTLRKTNPVPKLGTEKTKKPRQSLTLPAPSASKNALKTPPVPQEPGHKPALRAELTSGIQLVTPGQGRRFVEGSQLYDAGRYADAAGVWQALAEEGVVEAQFRLGELYFQGQGLAQNTPQAVHWLTRAADRGHRGASSLLVRANAASQ